MADVGSTLPFVWPDVAIVHVLCAVPVAWMLAAAAGRRLRAAGLLGLAVCIMGVNVVPMLGELQDGLRNVLVSYPLLGLLLRTAVSAGAAASAALLGVVLIRGRRGDHRGGREGRRIAVLGLAALAAVLLPWTYVSARVRHDHDKVGELIGQSRVGEARALVQDLLVLNSGANWNGYALSEVAADLERTVGELEGRVAVPLQPHATADERLTRARHLAMLGRSDKAAQIVQTVGGPEAANLYATIRENEGAWDEALKGYAIARRAWEAQPPSTGRTAGVLHAVRGMAYSQRKLGRYDQAEATYQELLALAPTAESHYLAAQFYEDAQQAEQARVHARAAMAMAPQTYRQQGERLIRKLSVYHFGCLGVYRAESSP